MMRLLLPILLATTWPADAASAAVSDPAVQAVRDLIALQCPCGEAATRRVYLLCSKAVIGQAVADGRITSKQGRAALKCSKTSTCGRPDAVTCCRRTASGRVKCNVKKDASQCRTPSGGTACVRSVASCCDSCSETGTCPAPTTTTSTLLPASCGNGVRDAGEECDGNDFGTATCPGSSVVGAFLECTPECEIDSSGCPSVTTTTTTPSPTTTSTPLPTTTSTTSTTSTTLPDVGCSDPLLHLPPLVKLPIDLVAGSSSCGGTGLNPGPTSPFAGRVEDASRRTLGRLGTGCFYVGGGAAPIAPLGIPAGSQMVVNLVGLRGFTAIAGPSDGTGPTDCTRGAGPGRHCLNGAPGTDGAGACATDAQCGGASGACALDARCFFGSSISLTSPLEACVVNTILKDFCAEAELIGFGLDIRGALSSRVYLGACPTCTSGRCVGGARAGQTCSASRAAVDCPPAPAGFVGAFPSVQRLSTDQQTLASPSGQFCSGQASPGAFGLPAARRIRTEGDTLNIFTLQTSVAGPFCALPSGNALLDGAAGLPAPGAVAVKARVDLPSLIRLFGL